MLKVIRVIFYTLGALVLSSSVNMAVVAPEKADHYLFLSFAIGIIISISLIFMIIGVALNKFRSFRFPVGVSIVSSMGFSLLVLLTIFSMSFDETFGKMITREEQNGFKLDFAAGFIVNLTLLAIGLALMFTSREYKELRLKSKNSA